MFATENSKSNFKIYIFSLFFKLKQNKIKNQKPNAFREKKNTWKKLFFSSTKKSKNVEITKKNKIEN